MADDLGNGGGLCRFPVGNNQRCHGVGFAQPLHIRVVIIISMCPENEKVTSASAVAQPSECLIEIGPAAHHGNAGSCFRLHIFLVTAADVLIRRMFSSMSHQTEAQEQQENSRNRARHIPDNITQPTARKHFRLHNNLSAAVASKIVLSKWRIYDEETVGGTIGGRSRGRLDALYVEAFRSISKTTGDHRAA